MRQQLGAVRTDIGAGAGRTCAAQCLPPPLLLLAALVRLLVGVVWRVPDAWWGRGGRA